MAKFWCFILILLWFSYLFISSILLFTRGFLLTRDVQNNVSLCISEMDFDHFSYNDGHKHETWLTSFLKETSEDLRVCLQPQAKVVLLIVDAMRYDFLLYDENKIDPLPYENRMPIFSRLLEKYPNNTRVYKFIADPPTTTMQRLKALTTGSLPTFIDAGSNFATQEILEDNIIDQVVSNQYAAVFIGDDTWTALYPNRFLRSYPYPSFDVWDLDTVDKGVKEQIFPELKKKDWNLLIGHFLGVDHCGHRYGPNHFEMKRKLEEINGVIEKVVLALPEDTMLFIVGDHGMTSTGDHGGDSVEETTAGMFVYSTNNLKSIGERPISVKQVDLIPTLSSILGIPIPFQNLGTVILDSLPVTSDAIPHLDWHTKLFFLWSNVRQVVDYLNATSLNSKIMSSSVLNMHLKRHSDLRSELLVINSKEAFVEFDKNVRLFLNNIRTIYEEAWVQFDTSLMRSGLLFLFLSIFFVFILTDGLPIRNLLVIFDKCLSSSTFVGFLILLLILVSFSLYNHSCDISNRVFLLFSTLSQLVFAFLTIQNWDLISLNWYEKSKNDKIVSFIYKIMIIFNLLISFSNSYIYEESGIHLFSLITVILLGTVNISSCLNTDQNLKIKSDKPETRREVIEKLKFFLLAIIFAAFVRLSVYFWRCRVEQEWCFAVSDSTGHAWFKVEASKLQWALSGLFLAFFVISTKQWLQHLGNLNGLSSNVILMKFVPTVIVVCIAGYWVLEKLPGQKTNLKIVNYLALSVYGFTFICVLALFLRPLCVYMVPRSSDMNIPLEENMIPQIYKKIKERLFQPTKNSKADHDIPVVYGLGTVYSAAFFMLGVYFVLLFNLLLGVTTGPSAIIMFASLCFILMITSVWRIERGRSIDDLFDVPNLCVLIWIVLSQYFFYATGHQPTFPNINWEAAFIGTSGLIRNNYILGTLIIINTFCSNILMGVLLPLLVIAPFTIFVILPSVIAKKDKLFKMASRGELTLFEKDNLTNSSLFTLACKYFAVHGIRVFASMLAATIHCRHLMVWSVFAPKLIFEVIGLFVTVVSVFFGYCLFYRINVEVERLVNKLNKSS